LISLIWGRRGTITDAHPSGKVSFPSTAVGKRKTSDTLERGKRTSDENPLWSLLKKGKGLWQSRKLNTASSPGKKQVAAAGPKQGRRRTEDQRGNIPVSTCRQKVVVVILKMKRAAVLFKRTTPSNTPGPSM